MRVIKTRTIFATSGDVEGPKAVADVPTPLPKPEALAERKAPKPPVETGTRKRPHQRRVNPIREVRRNGDTSAVSYRPSHANAATIRKRRLRYRQNVRTLGQIRAQTRAYLFQTVIGYGCHDVDVAGAVVAVQTLRAGAS